MELGNTTNSKVFWYENWLRLGGWPLKQILLICAKALALTAVFCAFYAIFVFTSSPYWWDAWAWSWYGRYIGFSFFHIFLPYIILPLSVIFLFKKLRRGWPYRVFRKILPLVWIFPIAVCFEWVIIGGFYFGYFFK